MEKNCSTCQFLDEWFGDCCHPDSGGCEDLGPALNNCGEKTIMHGGKKELSMIWSFVRIVFK